MRTLTLRQWTLKNWLANLIDGERKYSVQGELVFKMLYRGVPPGVVQISQTIYEVDAKFPWHDDIHPDAGKFESISYLGEGSVRDYDTGLYVFFTIIPKLSNMRKGQVYAYEKYLAKLAEELAKKFDDVEEVRSIIEVRASTSFSVF